MINISNEYNICKSVLITHPAAETVSAALFVLTDSKADELSEACNSVSFLVGPFTPPVKYANMWRLGQKKEKITL
jgi:hypothetical protein